MLREKSNIFFVFIFPIAIILLIGAQFGGGVAPAVGIHVVDDDQLAVLIVDELTAEEQMDVLLYETADQVVSAVERGNLQAGILLPGGMDATAASGEVVGIEYVARPGGLGFQLQAVIGAAVSRVMTPVAAAQFASTEVGATFDEALVVAVGMAPAESGINATASAVGESLFPSTLGQFDLGAAQQLVLFVFLTALAGSAALILSRKLGISSRMLSTPTSMGTVVMGEATGRWGTAMVQGLYIMVATFLLFRVNWGDPLGAFLVLVTFAATGAGAGLLMGAVFSNDQQAGGVGVILSIGLAALGGSMVPSELFSDTMQKVAHITPHAWALDAFAELVRHNGTTVDILAELGVLAAYAAVLLMLATWRLRVVLTRP
jgi:ABC-2 type transport system permease protein